MIGIVVTGHGHFAQGLSSAVQLIAGQQAQYKEVYFLEADGPEKLNQDIRDAIAEVNTGSGVLVFTDLKGGTPFKESVMISTEHTDVEVLTGTNVAMLLEASLARMGEPEIKGFVRTLVETGASQVDFFDMADLESNDDEEDMEDGI